jgi:ABC-type transport system involved in cytochrome c biogenesis permease subunit
MGDHALAGHELGGSGLFLLTWCEWFVFIYRHWEHVSQTSGLIAVVVLLALLPFPCVLTFWKKEQYPPFAAFLTYMLLNIAFQVAFGRSV